MIEILVTLRTETVQLSIRVIRRLWQFRLFLLVIPVAGALHLRAQGGPPFITDDPGTPGNRNWEINLGWIGDNPPGAPSPPRLGAGNVPWPSTEACAIMPLHLQQRAIFSAASVELMTGYTSNSTRSSQLAMHRSKSARSSVFISWKQRSSFSLTQLDTYESPAGANRPPEIGDTQAQHLHS